MSIELKKKCDRLLRSFCEKECLNNRDVPRELTDYVLGCWTLYVQPGLEDELERQPLEETDFFDRFEAYCLAQPKTRTRLDPNNQINLGDVSKLQQIVDEVIASKKLEAGRLKEAYQSVIDQRTKTHDKFENVVMAESLYLGVLTTKMDLIHFRTMDLLYKETPAMQTALKKLKLLIEEERRNLEKRKSHLEDLKISYKGVENNEEYFKLLVKYKQLSLKRMSLQMV